MAIIPFAKEAYKRQRASTPEQTLLNFFVEKDESGDPQDPDEQVMLLQRPGLTPYNSLPAAIQDIYVASNPSLDYKFAVANNILYKFDDVDFTALGTMSGSLDPLNMVANFDRLAVVSYPLLYCYGATSTSTDLSFRNIAIPDLFATGLPKAVDVASLNAYFIVACEDGTFLWLEPGQDDFNALNFATAESDPDGLVAVRTLHGNLFFFGKRTIEVWQPSGDADLPFQRTSGSDYSRGCYSRDTLQNLDNAIFWVGEDLKVYRTAAVPERVSTDGIDERLRSHSGLLDSWTFSFDGHLFYVLTIGDQGTFAYDVATKTWSQFSSVDTNAWRPIAGAQADEGYLAGSRDSGDIWLVSEVATDGGVAFPRRASATAPLPNKPMRVDKVAFDVGASAACTFNLRWADSDEELSDQPWVDLPCPKGGEILTYPRMGAARSPYRTIELQVTDPVVVRISGARTGSSWR